MNDHEESIRIKLAGFVEHDKGNTLASCGGMKIFDEPLLGIASAADDLFDRFAESEIIGPDFQKPGEWLPGAVSILSFFLPFTSRIIDSNRKPGLPSGEWTSARIEGEAFNNSVRTYLIDLLKGFGAKAVAPAIDPRFRVIMRKSNWSERHAAFVAGLGTFGLHRALITEKGTCGRLGSVITGMFMTPTPRKYSRYDEFCIFLRGGKCGACIKRCPPSAISATGKDNGICSDYIDREVLPVFKPRHGCAKCNVNVPCERGIPSKIEAAR